MICGSWVQKTQTNDQNTPCKLPKIPEYSMQTGAPAPTNYNSYRDLPLASSWINNDLPSMCYASELWALQWWHRQGKPLLRPGPQITPVTSKFPRAKLALLKQSAGCVWGIALWCLVPNCQPKPFVTLVWSAWKATIKVRTINDCYTSAQWLFTFCLCPKLPCTSRFLQWINGTLFLRSGGTVAGRTAHNATTSPVPQLNFSGPLKGYVYRYVCIHIFTYVYRCIYILTHI